MSGAPAAVAAPAQALIPVTIVTGFLGSGKTTLLAGLVKRRQSRRLALLINEFGEVSIDGALMRDSAAGAAHVQIQDFPYGLIAYGADDHFVPTMQALAQRRAQLDHVLIETSGLALPSAVMEALQSAELAGDFILDATLAVVDTPLLLAGQFDAAHGADAVASVFEQQLAHADVVVLNKIDALDEAALLAAETRVRERAPKVRFLELAYRAELDIRLALGLRLHQPAASAHTHGAGRQYTALPGMPAADARTLLNQQRLNGHTHSGLGRHSHGLETHKHFHEQDPGWLSFVLRSAQAQQPEAVQAALREIAAREPLLRAKGFLRTPHAPHAVLVQGVRSRVTLSDAPAQAAPARSELVLIGYHLDRGAVAAALSELTSSTWK
jgi:cobalamin biosynthesis protein CobW